MIILIVGGSGFLGQALSADLLSVGHEVRILSRSLRLPDSMDARVKLVTCPSPTEVIDSAGVTGVDVVINLAGESLGAGRWSEARKARMFDTRVKTTRNLVAAIAQADPRPKSMINGSAVGYYGPYGDEELTEASQPGGDFLATLCSHWEDESKKAIRSGVRLTIVRTGIVLGKGAMALERMMTPFKFFVGGPLGNGRQVMSWIHVDDWVGIVRMAVENDGVSGPVNVTAPNPMSNREFSRTLGHVMRRPSLFPAPAFMIRLVLGEMADMVLTGQRVIPKRALEYGYRFKYPDLNDAMTSIIRG